MKKDRFCFLGILLGIFTSLVNGAKWHTIKSAGFHTPREETAFSACGGNDICLLGGRNIRKTQVLNTKSLSWSEGSEPPLEIHHFQGVTGPDGCAWILGAWTGKFPGEATVNEIYRYCSEISKWEIVGQMSRPRGAGGAIYYNGYFYVVSGNVGGHQASANVVPWFDRYDPKTKKWTEMPDIPDPRDHLNVAVIENKLYAIGGRDSGGANYPDFFDLTEEKVDVFDFSTNSWSKLEENFPEPRAGSPVVVYKNQIWVAGGEGSGKAWDEVTILEGSRFRNGPKMPNPRHGFGMVSCNDVVWVAGGAGTQGGGYSQTMLDAYFEGSWPKPCTVSDQETISNGEPIKVLSSPTPTSEPIPTDLPISSSSPTLSVHVSGTPSASTITTSDSSTPSPSTTIPPISTDLSVPNLTPTYALVPSPSIAPPVNISVPSSTPHFSPNVSVPSSNTTIPSDVTTPSASPTSTNNASQPSPRPSGSVDTLNGRACFPGHSRVKLEDGSVKSMEDLEIGDKILVEHPNFFSDVYFFSHRHKNHVSSFISLKMEGGYALHVSDRHFLYVNGRMVEAMDVKIGDKISVAREDSDKVVQFVDRIVSKGLYNPHTIHGDIIVNNISASTYSGTVHPSIARVLLKPFQLVYRALGPHPAVQNVNDHVLRTLERFVWKT